MSVAHKISTIVILCHRIVQMNRYLGTYDCSIVYLEFDYRVLGVFLDLTPSLSTFY